MLRLLPPAPQGWVQAAQELPLARAAIESNSSRARRPTQPSGSSSGPTSSVRSPTAGYEPVAVRRLPAAPAPRGGLTHAGRRRLRHLCGAHRSPPSRAARGAGSAARGSGRRLGARGSAGDRRGRRPDGRAAVARRAGPTPPESPPRPSRCANEPRSSSTRTRTTYRQALEARNTIDETAKPEQRDWALGQRHRRRSRAAARPRAPRRRPGRALHRCRRSRVEPRVHADVAAAAALAAAVARGARALVATNLTALPGDTRVEEADRLVAAADAAAKSA